MVPARQDGSRSCCRHLRESFDTRSIAEEHHPRVRWQCIKQRAGVSGHNDLMMSSVAHIQEVFAELELRVLMQGGFWLFYDKEALFRRILKQVDKI